MDALTISLNHANGATLQRLADLIDGQQVRAVVTANTGEGTFRLRIGSLSLDIQTTLALQTGERLDLVVARNANQLQLTIANRPGGISSVRFAHAIPQLTPGTSQLVTITRTAGALIAHLTTASGRIEAPLLESSALESGSYLARVTGTSSATGLALLEPLDDAAGILLPRGSAAESFVRYGIGDRIPAVALSSSQGENNSLRVALAEQTVELRANFHIDQGTRLLLEVARLSPRIELRLVTAPALPTAADDAATATLLQAIPTQANLQTLIQSLAELVTRGDLAIDPAIPALLAQVPELTDLSEADTLVAQLANSGSRLEANLAHATATQQTAVAGTDLKATLLNLSALLAASAQPGDSIDPAATALLARIRGSLQPDDVLSAVLHLRRDDVATLSSNALLALSRGATQSALARINVLQLQHLMSNSPPPIVLAELPVRLAGDVGSLRVMISGQGKKQSKSPSKRAWSAEIRLDLEQLPDFRARVTLRDREVSVVLHSGDEKTRQRMLTQQDMLRGKLAARNLTVGGIRVGRTPATPPENKSSGLLDVHA